MAFNVNDFRSRLALDGARPNLFEVRLALPSIVLNSDSSSSTLSFMAKTAQVPGSQINTVPIYYFGREIKFAGNRSFPDWTISIINDEDFAIRNSLENWMNLINSHRTNVRDTRALNHQTGYTSDGQVYHYGKTGPSNILKAYKFIGMFPIDISPIELDWGSNDTIEEYSVTFAYQHWEVSQGATGITT